MKILVFCALVFCLETVFAQTVSIQAHYTSPVNKTVVFKLTKQLALTCNVTADTSVDQSKIEIGWKKEGISITAVPTLKNRFKLSNQGLTYSLTIGEGNNNDVGNWSCHVLLEGQEQDSSQITVVTTIAVKIKTDNINVVEEEKLRIECSVLGNPYPALSWRIQTANYNFSDTDPDFDSERVKIQDYTDDNSKLVENGVLIIEKVNKSDRGIYFCIATNRFYEGDREESQSMIRIKDKYAALWPFLGICLEVIVLCAVIIIYEKKRNKTEMEESDTDQSPDQKNTPDNGKETNLRQRQ